MQSPEWEFNAGAVSVSNPRRLFKCHLLSPQCPLQHLPLQFRILINKFDFTPITFVPLLTGPTSQMGARGPTSPPQAKCRHGGHDTTSGVFILPPDKTHVSMGEPHTFRLKKGSAPTGQKNKLFVLKETTHFRGHDGFPVQMYCLRPQGPPPHQPQKCSWTKTQSHLRFEGDTGRAATDANPAGTEPRRPRRSRDLIQQRVWSAPPNHCPKISPHTSTLGLASDCPSPAQGPPEFMQEATGRTPYSRRQRGHYRALSKK